MWSVLFFQQFTGLWIHLFKRFFGIHGCYTLISNNVTGFFAKKAMSGDIAAYLHFCTDLLPRGNTPSVGVKGIPIAL